MIPFADGKICAIISAAVWKSSFFAVGLWLSLVERCVRDAEVASSNLVNPTTKFRNRHQAVSFFAKRARPLQLAFCLPVWLHDRTPATSTRSPRNTHACPTDQARHIASEWIRQAWAWLYHLLDRRALACVVSYDLYDRWNRFSECIACVFPDNLESKAPDGMRFPGQSVSSALRF